MSLIIVKNKKILSIPHLWRAVLKFIYDEKNMSLAEIREMQESIVSWTSAVKLEQEKLAQIRAADLKVFGKALTTAHKYSEEEYQLEAMGKMLVENERGAFNARKVMFSEHAIDYRKFHREFFSAGEIYEKEDFINGQKALEKAKAANPEDYE